jgi:hypothetical protein
VQVNETLDPTTLSFLALKIISFLSPSLSSNSSPSHHHTCLRHIPDLLIHHFFIMSSNNEQQTQQKSKQQKWEEIQIMKRKAEEQLRLVAMQEQALKNNGDESELDSISARLNRASLNGPVSEPTTPPDYSEGPFSSGRYSRSSRMSTNSIISPPGLGSRLSQPGSQITSPAGRLSGSMYTSAHRASTKSMPGSRRGSDEEEDFAEDLPNIRPAGMYVYPSSSLIPYFPSISEAFLPLTISFTS